MSATPYEPTTPPTRTEYADVLAVSGGLVDLDFGDGSDPVTGVGCYGALPGVGERVLVLLQGHGATVLTAGVGGRVFGESVRTTDITTAVTTDVAPPVVLTDAPPGLYQVTATVLLATTGTGYTSNWGQIVFGGQAAYEGWRWDASDAYRWSRVMSRCWSHDGGTLIVAAKIRGDQFTIYAGGSNMQVARISP